MLAASNGEATTCLAHAHSSKLRDTKERTVQTKLIVSEHESFVHTFSAELWVLSTTGEEILERFAKLTARGLSF